MELVALCADGISGSASLGFLAQSGPIKLTEPVEGMGSPSRPTLGAASSTLLVYDPVHMKFWQTIKRPPWPPLILALMNAPGSMTTEMLLLWR